MQKHWIWYLMVYHRVFFVFKLVPNGADSGFRNTSLVGINAVMQVSDDVDLPQGLISSLILSPQFQSLLSNCLLNVLLKYLKTISNSTCPRQNF